VLREILEETGIEAELLNAEARFTHTEPAQLPPPANIGVYNLPDGDGGLREAHQHIDLIYFARPAEGQSTDLPIDRHQWRWVTEGELREATALHHVASDTKQAPREDVCLQGISAIEADRAASLAIGAR
jgi:8-oxo-dGTP pyrophosphatase MutT (NUDIX family)